MTPDEATVRERFRRLGESDAARAFERIREELARLRREVDTTRRQEVTKP